MKRASTVAVWGAAVVIVLAGGYVAAWPIDRFAALLQADAILPEASPAWGIGSSIIGAVLAFLYIKYSQNRHDPGHIRAYRWAESALVAMGKMESGEILEYHRSYNWHAYAGLAFSTLFIIVALFLGDQIGERSAIQYFAIVFGFGLLAVSTIILSVIDLVHTNTLTPLVTAGRRFEIIDRVILFGGVALALQIGAVGVFLSLISSWLSILSSLVALTLIVFLTRLRAVPVDAIREERKLSREEVDILVRSQERR